MSSEAVNERIKGYLREPMLYLTTVVIGDKKLSCLAWSESDDKQTAEGISLHHLVTKRGVSLSSVGEVTTVAQPNRR